MQSPYVIYVGSADAPEIRSMLRKYWLAGVTAVEVRQWVLWRKFTVTGPAEAIQRLREEHARWQTDQMLDRAW